MLNGVLSANEKRRFGTRNYTNSSWNMPKANSMEYYDKLKKHFSTRYKEYMDKGIAFNEDFNVSAELGIDVRTIKNLYLNDKAFIN